MWWRHTVVTHLGVFAGSLVDSNVLFDYGVSSTRSGGLDVLTLDKGVSTAGGTTGVVDVLRVVVGVLELDVGVVTIRLLIAVTERCVLASGVVREAATGGERGLLMRE